MIQNIKHKGLRLLWEHGDTNKLPADQISRIERMLDVIDSVLKVPEDFGAYQNWNKPRRLQNNFRPAYTPNRDGKE